MSDKTSIINSFKAGGEEIFKLENTILQACDGASKAEFVIACLALAISMQYPDISAEDRVEGVQDVSRYICLWLDNKVDKDREEITSVN